MFNIVTKKYCSLCKQTKLLSNFYKNRHNKDGFQAYCIPCHKIKQRKFLQSEKGKKSRISAQKKYRTSLKGIIANKQYNQSEKGKKIRLALVRKHQIQHPEQIKAKNAVTNAVMTGKISPPCYIPCARCSGQAQHYHHQSYAPNKRLDVMAVCAKCHKKIHSNHPEVPQ